MRVIVVKSTYIAERSVFSVEVDGQQRELTEDVLADILAGDADCVDSRILSEGALV